MVQESVEKELKFEDMPILGILSQVARMSENSAKQFFEKFDLKPWQAGILIVLCMRGELSQRELASSLNQTPPSITTAIQKMEKAGYIARKPDLNDQRVLRLSLTEKSREYLRHIQEATNQMEEHVLRGMSAEEKLLFKRLLLQVKTNLAGENEMDFFKQHAGKHFGGK